MYPGNAKNTLENYPVVSLARNVLEGVFGYSPVKVSVKTAGHKRSAAMPQKTFQTLIPEGLIKVFADYSTLSKKVMVRSFFGFTKISSGLPCSKI